MPIKGRIDMLSTGLRTPVGLKISGADLDTIEEIGARIEALLPVREGDPERLCRADRQRLLSRLRVEPGGTGPLRPEHRGGAEPWSRRPSAGKT